MPALCKTDPTRGPGYGILEVPELTLQSAPAFALYRASDGLCLAPGGWQPAEFFLAPDAWDADAGALRMAVGPSVVDELDTLDTYRLFIRADGKTTSQTMLVQDILYSPQHGGGGIAAHTPAAPPPVQEPAPLPEPEPIPEPAPGPESLTMPPKEPRPTQSKAPLLIGLCLLLLAAAGGVWWFMQRDAAPKPEAAQAQPPATPAAQPKSPLDVAREHLRAGGDAAQSMELIKGMAAPEAADAVFLLVEDAAQKGQSEAMLRLAGFYDPASTAAKGSITPDAEQARAWYTKALAAGRQEAQTALDALRAWLEAAAAKGDMAAADMLRRWTPTP